MEGGTTFHFVTDRIESALEQAREAAGGKDVMLWGGGNIPQQYLAAGLLNELELHVVPVLLGDGARLFDNLGAAESGRPYGSIMSRHASIASWFPPRAFLTSSLVDSNTLPSFP